MGGICLLLLSVPDICWTLALHFWHSAFRGASCCSANISFLFITDMTAKSKEPMACWICGGTSWKPFKTSSLNASVTSDDFKITDAHYGRTGRIDQCLSCGFRQCGDLDSVLGFYEDLEDAAYDQGREQRALQARKIIEAVQPFTKGRRLLDVGAASGILLESAQKLGFEGEGIEPSK